ncbi:hypothetical protein KDU71_12485 [Carboxylicivirga sediminis]|uniref:Uncharacterized protein n=1 Tax=Carboxylicivirga sediminis TaxID=2006564 RepID=A0A941F404_9BACT|nr:hypothetical protein [Carboxylicivirga sediminis]MBR8536381.1 hypothetical protein [Carboxylicivirga sediminis]
MTKFWEIIISAVVGAGITILGAILTMNIQDNRTLKSAKRFVSIELEQMKYILVDIRKQALDQNGTLSVDVIQNKLIDSPSDFETYKVSLVRMKSSEFRKIRKIYNKINEFEDLRQKLIQKKEDGIDLSSISNKEDLSTEEKTLKKYMEIYLNYYLNMELLIKEVDESYKLVR